MPAEAGSRKAEGTVLVVHSQQHAFVLKDASEYLRHDRPKNLYLLKKPAKIRPVSSTSAIKTTKKLQRITVRCNLLNSYVKKSK
ncbi:hypothetical protein DMO16_00225 [Fictibacillus sp. S7]|nr:hypothetical protein DMO16_00225 [Fictibacillus sp. S7]